VGIGYWEVLEVLQLKETPDAIRCYKSAFALLAEPTRVVLGSSFSRRSMSISHGVRGRVQGLLPRHLLFNPTLTTNLRPSPALPSPLAESTLVRDERSFCNCTRVGNLPQGRTGRTFVPVHLPGWFPTPHPARLPRACPEDMSAPRRVSSTAGKRLRIPDTLPLEKGNACTSCESSLCSTPATSPTSQRSDHTYCHRPGRARKVRCDAGVPTCGACLKTDPGVACEYGSKRPRRRSLDYATSPLTSGTRSASSARAGE
jgi:hypothetical protein